MIPTRAVLQEQNVFSVDVFHWDATVTPTRRIQTVSVPLEMFARIAHVNPPSLQAVTVIQRLMIPTPVAVLVMSVSSASVFHLDVNVIQKLTILTVSVLLDKSARIVNVGNLFLQAASVIQSLIIQTNCVQMISGELNELYVVNLICKMTVFLICTECTANWCSKSLNLERKSLSCLSFSKLNNRQIFVFI